MGRTTRFTVGRRLATTLITGPGRGALRSARWFSQCVLVFGVADEACESVRQMPWRRKNER
jgi:hypothetical protein